MLTVFGDESSDETGSRVFAVAGVIGRQEEWDELEKTWVKRTGEIIFHAADCDSDRGDFATTGHENNKKLYKDLTRLLTSTKLMGHGVAIDLGGYRHNFPEAIEETAYFMCFTRIIIRFAQLASAFIPQDKVKFIFDVRHQVTYNAGLLYDRLSNFAKWDIHSYMDEISFKSSKSVGIQVADLWARETMKHLDNMVGPQKRPMRQSMRALSDTGRFKSVFYMQEFFNGLKENTDKLGENAKMTRSKYDAYLRKYNLQDNMTNRINYIAETDLAGLLGND